MNYCEENIKLNELKSKYMTVLEEAAVKNSKYYEESKIKRKEYLKSLVSIQAKIRYLECELKRYKRTKKPKENETSTSSYQKNYQELNQN